MSGYLMPHERPRWREHIEATEVAEERQRRDEQAEREALAESKRLTAAAAAHAVEAYLGYDPAEAAQARQAAMIAASEDGTTRDPADGYGSAQRPALLIGGEEIRPRLEDGSASRSDADDQSAALARMAEGRHAWTRSRTIRRMVAERDAERQGGRDADRAREIEQLESEHDGELRARGVLPGARRERGHITRVTQGPQRLAGDY